MASFVSTAKALAVTTGKEAMDDDVPSLAAAIAYYTVFSLPPLLVVIVAVAGAVFGADAVQQAITGQIGSMMGPEGAAEVEGMIASSSDMGSGIGSKLAGLAALLFGATGAFGQLQKSMNRAWEVEEQAGGGVLATVMKRVLSFGMILTIAFLLLVSLAVSAVLAAVGDAASSVAPEGLAQVGMHAVNIVVSLGVITVLFAAMFKWLPDADVAWRDVWVGAFATAVLFTIGKTAIGLYLGKADPGSAFGAAGSLALLLVWIYYSALIVLVGVEFTQAWAEQKGSGIDPEAGGTSTDDADRGASSAASGPPAPGEPTSDATGADGRPFSIEDAASGATRR
jgi:membrane protein